MSSIRNHKDCAHVWAAQSRQSGKSGPLYFEGRTIYSYGLHYPIATFTDAGPVLFNANGSSTTTQSKHKPAVRNALCGLNVRVFVVPHVEDYAHAHAENLAFLVTQRADNVRSAARARSSGEFYIARADEAEADAIAYAEAFNLPRPEFPEIDGALIEKTREDAKRESARRKAERAERDRLAALSLAEKIEAWRAGQSVSLGYSHGPTLLRLREDGAVIETSRGARVPASVARHLWRASCLARKTARGETFNGAPRDVASVGDYTLREIRDDGALVIGCHVLEFAELARMAETLGFEAFDGVPA